MRESSHVSDDLRRTAVPVPLAGALRTRERNRPVSDSRLAKHLTATVWWREPDRTPVAPPQGRRGRVQAGGVGNHDDRNVIVMIYFSRLLRFTYDRARRLGSAGVGPGGQGRRGQ